MKNLKKLKITFCPGPGAVILNGSIIKKSILGEGDEEYKKIKNKTLKWLRKKSGQDHVIPVPGAATTAAIIALNSFVEGNVLVINTGYYSTRWFNYLKKTNIAKKTDFLSFDNFIKKKLHKNINI